MLTLSNQYCLKNVFYSHKTSDLMDLCSLLVKSEDLCPPATLSSILGVSSTSSSSLLVGGTQGDSSAALMQADDSPLLRSLSPILPLSQTSAGIGQEVSLTNVFVPLDAIKPSESQEIGFMLMCFKNFKCPNSFVGHRKYFTLGQISFHARV